MNEIIAGKKKNNPRLIIGVQLSSGTHLRDADVKQK